MTQSNASQKLYISMPTNSKRLKSMPSFIPQQLPSSNWHLEKAHKEKGRGLYPLSWSTPGVPCFCPWTFPVKPLRDLQSGRLFTLCPAETLVCQRPQCLYDLGVSLVSDLDSDLRSSNLGSGVTVKSESESHSVVSDSLWPRRLCSPWNSPGQNTEWVVFPLLQGTFPTQGSNPGLLHCRWLLYQLSHQGSPRVLEWVAYPFSSGSSWPRNQTGVFCIAGRFSDVD